MSRPAHPSARRRHLAVLACLAWLLGVEVLPGVHLALHDQLAVHDHGDGVDSAPADKLVVRVHRDRVAHHHGGVVHRHGADAVDPAAPGDRAEVDGGAPAPLGHGRHSLAHHALALIAPSPAILHPLPVDHRPRAIAHVVAQLVATAPPPEAAARAPPIRA